jgi:hypothetical protein
LQLLGHRYYDSSTGRFLTRDPIKDGRNWYTYCDNDPVNGTDPSGLRWHDPAHVSVSPDFKGKVGIVGEETKGGKQVYRELKPGEQSPANMDVDIIIITYPDGTERRFFLPGTNSAGNRADSYYTVNASGEITFNRWAKTYLTFISPLSDTFDVPVYLPVLAPREFTKETGGYSKTIFGGSGNWNSDIEIARGGGRRGKRIRR